MKKLLTKDQAEKKIAHTTPPPPRVNRRSPHPQESGSVIVGVMVALVFIGIVTAAMVKATGGQSTASRNYGSTLLMSSTANSGIIATETFFRNNTAETDADGRKMITDMINAVFLENDTQYINFGGNLTPGHKFELSKNPEQFFSSKIVDVITQDGRFFARVEVNSGRNPAGRDLQKATAFFEVENLEIEDGGGEWVKNAFYVGEDMAELTFNSSVRFEGNVTLARSTQQTDIFVNNSAAKVEFAKAGEHGDAFFQGGIHFNNPQVSFETKAYFNSHFEMQTAGSWPEPNLVFQDDVGFRGNFWSRGHSDSRGLVDVAGNVWIGGRFDNKGNTGTITSAMRSVGTDKTFHYTDDLRMVGPNCVNVNGRCTFHNMEWWRHIGPGAETESQRNIGPTGFANMPNPLPSMDSTTILSGLGMRHLESRKEPNLVLDVGAKKFFSLSELMRREGGDMINGDAIENFIKMARGDAAFDQYFHPNRRDPTSHFLIDMDTRIGWSGGSFNEKVVFNVEKEDLNANGNFYSSGANASTMIYVSGKDVRLTGFGPHEGDFRGLVYVHQEAKGGDGHTFHWPKEGTIHGAVLFNGGNRLTWRPGAKTTIRQDGDITAAFSNMLRIHGTDDFVGGGGGEGNGLTIKTGEVVNLRQIGVYFH
ncbi:MAG: hypothetical protein LBC70_04415 [Chitinispirillales bacterium]|jgi:Tfp pilus assembly protein PilX|nr:hypothetical protein [Chitinispirillales bacterium]